MQLCSGFFSPLHFFFLENSILMEDNVHFPLSSRFFCYRCKLNWLNFENRSVSSTVCLKIKGLIIIIIYQESLDIVFMRSHS